MKEKKRLRRRKHKKYNKYCKERIPSFNLSEFQYRFNFKVMERKWNGFFKILIIEILPKLKS